MKKLKNFLLISICVTSLVGCVANNINSDEIENKPIQQKQSSHNSNNTGNKKNTNTTSDENVSDDSKNLSNYDAVDLYKPNENPESAIEQALNDIYNLKDETDLSSYNIDLNKFQNSLLKTKLNYNVEIFYLEYFEIDFKSKKVIYHYGFDKDKILTMKEKLNTEVNKFLSTINPSMSELEKELAIHDYIIQNASYDNNGFENMQRIIISGSCYGTLVEKSAVCSGYSAAFNLLCKVSELEAFSLLATGHAWNIVKVNGEYYQIDVLWDDISWGEGIDYKYFNLSDDKMNETHAEFARDGYEWINDIYPKCTSEKYDHLNNQNNIHRDNKYFYYIDYSKESLAKINIQTGEKSYIEKVSPCEFIIENDWIYYIDKIDSYLYKVKTNGEDNHLLVDTIVYGLNKKNNKIYYTENTTNTEKEI
ncbi:DUF5050 domain-containing protein [Oceanirhabdus sp. W0125-5]|uniref:DUF5050 domain-containing protein n=1 Tax=Oceanirhabdus sp. W0125-5 TaxID=2999116 RepID=UPI0022F2E845|nr:DUF5050 domain-containing protein [Oceanirhabdus sp. W0125-5]WBW96656.1 DUF5050 domain-containing protein [Oceanirhabdus sp. W0125-5]